MFQSRKGKNPSNLQISTPFLSCTHLLALADLRCPDLIALGVEVNSLDLVRCVNGSITESSPPTWHIHIHQRWFPPAFSSSIQLPTVFGGVYIPQCEIYTVLIS